MIGRVLKEVCIDGADGEREISTTSQPAARRSSAPSQATKRSGSRQASTTRGIPAARMSCVQVSGCEERLLQGSRLL